MLKPSTRYTNRELLLYSAWRPEYSHRESKLRHIGNIISSVKEYVELIIGDV